MQKTRPSAVAQRAEFMRLDGGLGATTAQTIIENRVENRENIRAAEINKQTLSNSFVD